LKVPHGDQIDALRPLVPLLLSYLLSFLYIAIYWCNHHHLLQAAERVNSWILWANIHLLFWLSLIPFATAWMGENHFAPWTVAVYGGVLLAAGGAYNLLAQALISHHGPGSCTTRAIGGRRKGVLSLLIYATAIPLAFQLPGVACAAYLLVALLWVVPESRIERMLADRGRP